MDCARRTASSLNSNVYCRFETSSFLLILSSVHQKVTNILVYVKPRQGQSSKVMDSMSDVQVLG